MGDGTAIDLSFQRPCIHTVIAVFYFFISDGCASGRIHHDGFIGAINSEIRVLKSADITVAAVKFCIRPPDTGLACMSFRNIE